MSDITLFYDEEALHCDWSVGTGDMVCGNDLQTAILISLFTDRLADASDETDDGNRRDGGVTLSRITGSAPGCGCCAGRN